MDMAWEAAKQLSTADLKLLVAAKEKAEADAAGCWRRRQSSCVWLCVVSVNSRLGRVTPAVPNGASKLDRLAWS